MGNSFAKGCKRSKDTVGWVFEITRPKVKIKESSFERCNISAGCKVWIVCVEIKKGSVQKSWGKNGTSEEF